MTYRNNTSTGIFDDGEQFIDHYRNTINIGTLVYLSEDGIVRKVDTHCITGWNWDSIDYSTTIDTTQGLIQQIITEQQQSGLLQNTCFGIVQFMGLATFKLAEFTTTQTLLRPEKFGGWGTINYANLNSIIGVWDPSGILTRATVKKYTLDIYSGMADVTMMVNGVTY